MTRSAHVKSIDTVAHFKGSLQQYLDRVRQAVTMLQMEVRRGVDWIERERPGYWQAEVRKAADAVVEAKNQLQQRQLTIRPDETPACYEQTKAVERAKVRLRLAEEKVRTVRHWRQVLLKEAEQMQGMLATLLDHVEGDMPQAVATLERLEAALEKYAGRAASSSPAAAADELLPGDEATLPAAAAQHPAATDPGRDEGPPA